MKTKFNDVEFNARVNVKFEEKYGDIDFENHDEWQHYREKTQDTVEKELEKEFMDGEKGNDNPIHHCYLDRQGFMVYFDNAHSYATDHDLHFRG